jgi:hypothetical protein
MMTLNVLLSALTVFAVSFELTATAVVLGAAMVGLALFGG